MIVGGNFATEKSKPRKKEPRPKQDAAFVDVITPLALEKGVTYR